MSGSPNCYGCFPLTSPRSSILLLIGNNALPVYGIVSGNARFKTAIRLIECRTARIKS
ncbi:hypothetical protein BDW72DRAFT_19443 [Aspergillus terricola var. indicus]